MASKHRDIGLKFRHRSTPNTRRVTENVGFGGGGYHIYIHIYLFVTRVPQGLLQDTHRTVASAYGHLCRSTGLCG